MALLVLELQSQYSLLPGTWSPSDHFRLHPLGGFDWTLTAPTTAPTSLSASCYCTNTALTHAVPHYYWKGKAP